MQFHKVLYLVVGTVLIITLTRLTIFRARFVAAKNDDISGRMAVLYYGSTVKSPIHEQMLRHTQSLVGELLVAHKPRALHVICVKCPKESQQHMNIVANDYTPQMLSNLLKTYERLLVQFHHDSKNNVDSLFIALESTRGSVKSIVTTLHHSNETLLPTKQTLAIVRKIAQLSDHVVLPSETSAEAIKITHALPPSKVHFVPFINVSRSTVRVHSFERGIISTYACTDRIGLDQLLTAFGRLYSDNYIELQIAVCPELNISDGIIPTLVPENDLKSVVVLHKDNPMDVIIGTGFYVHLPLKSPELLDSVLHQVMLAGVPVLSLDYGYPGELLFNNRAPYWSSLIDPNNEMLFERKLCEFTQLHYRLRKRIGKKNRKQVLDHGNFMDLELARQYLGIMNNGEPVLRHRRKLACDPNSPYAHSFTRTGYVNFGFVETLDSKRFTFQQVFSKSMIVNLVSDPVLQINGRIHEQSHMDQMGVIWVDGTGVQHKLLLDTSLNYIQVDDMKLLLDGLKVQRELVTYQVNTRKDYVEGSSIKYGIIDDDDNSTSVKVEIDVASSRYVIELALHKVYNPGKVSWIDLMFNVQNDFVAAHGILGQSTRAKLQIEKTSSLLEGSWTDYVVKDGIMGTQFKYNLFHVDSFYVHAGPDGTSCAVPCQPHELQKLEQNTKVLSDNPHLTTSGFSTGSRELVLELIRSSRFRMIVRENDDNLPPLRNANERIADIKSRMVTINEAKRIKPDVAFKIRSDLGHHYDKCKNIYYTPWEYRGMLEHEARAADKADHVWAISRYVRQCYLDAGIEARKIAIVPHGVPKEAFKQLNPERSLAFPEVSGMKDFKFLFRGGSYPRKGLDLLVRNFLEEFTSQDPVVLIIHSSYGLTEYANSISEMIFDDNSQPRIIFSDYPLPDDESMGLYHEVDCYLSPYRSEGFGLTITEAMAAKLPVILTDYSGPRDYANPSNAYLIPAVETECHTYPCQRKAFLKQPSSQQPMWAVPDEMAFRKLLRHVVQNRKEAAMKGVISRKFLLSFWTMERAARMASRSLRQLSLAKKGLKKRKSKHPR
jgi:glycosyltransferase involved in cell wall biosynthesis